MSRFYRCPVCGHPDFHRIERIEVDAVGSAVTFVADADHLRCAHCPMLVAVGFNGSIRALVEPEVP